jgi:hypothetical protein
MSNVYHVILSDGPMQLWDSRFRQPDGLAFAFVSHAPLAGLAWVDVEDDSCDGRLAPCEHGRLHVRLFARNPFLGAPLDATTLELALPDGLVPASWTLSFMDNPLDAVTPTPEQLAADGVVTTPPGLFRVELATLETRFPVLPAPPPESFRDVLVVDLWLETPSAGLLPPAPVSLAGPVVTGTAGGRTWVESASGIPLPVAVGPPGEVSPAGTPQPLRFLSDKVTLTWEEPARSGAWSFDVYRGLVSGLREGAAGACLASGVVANAWSDPEPPPAIRGDGYFYLVVGVDCAGAGALGTGSDGVARRPAVECP